jgi:hypothetical protein
MALGRKTGGRKPGSRNKRTQERMAAINAAAAKIEKALAEPFTGDAHALLMSVYKDGRAPIELRLAAAKAAIGYEKPKLSSIGGTGEAVKQAIVRVPPKAKDADEWLKLYAPKTPN